MMPRMLQCWAIKDLNDCILIPTVAGSDVAAMTKILVGLKLYKLNPDHGYVYIRKQFKKLAEPKGYKAIQIMLTEIADDTSKALKGVHLNDKPTRRHKGSHHGTTNRQELAGRRGYTSTAKILAGE